jgi:Ca2+-binding RTX toxin-like protein
MDFNPAEDGISFSRHTFKKIGIMRILKEEAFHIGKKAHDASDRIIYDKGTGSLYYDPDGTGSAAKIKFAILANKALLAFDDFSVT